MKAIEEMYAFEEDISIEDEAEKERPFKVVSVSEMLEMADPDWIVKDYFYEDTINAFYGKPGAGKSHLTLGLMCHICLGRSWLGVHPVKQGKIVYIAAEGVRGYRKRIQAWARHMGVSPLDFNGKLSFIKREIPLKMDTVLEEVIAEIKCAYPDEMPMGIVIDTLFACASDVDINSPKGMTALFQAVRYIKRQTGVSFIIVIHHSGKDTARGMSGNVSLPGSCDIVYRIEAEETEYLPRTMVMKAEKMKDGQLLTFPLKLMLVQYGDGQYDNSLVTVQGEATTINSPKSEVKKQNAKDKVLKLLPYEGLKNTEWKKICEAAGIPTNTFNPSVKKLLEEKKIRSVGGVYRHEIDPNKDACPICETVGQWHSVPDGSYRCSECHPIDFSEELMKKGQ